MRGRLTVGQCPLKAFILVRIQTPQQATLNNFCYLSFLIVDLDENQGKESENGTSTCPELDVKGEFFVAETLMNLYGLTPVVSI